MSELDNHGIHVRFKGGTDARRPTRLGIEVVSAIRYIDAQEDFGPMTKNVLREMVKRIADAAIRDVEEMVR